MLRVNQLPSEVADQEISRESSVQSQPLKQVRVLKTPVLAEGYESIEGVVDQDQIDVITDELESVESPLKSGTLRNADRKFSTIHALASSPEIKALAQRYLDGTPKLTRAIYFNITKDNNWKASWHQENTVAVSRRFQKHGWGSWSVKEGLLHVQPPEHALNQMISIRVHLDEANLANGCLKICPNSHTLGLLESVALNRHIKNHNTINCEVSAGTALVMRPQLLRSYSHASSSSQRRVLHLEYSDIDLPSGVDWA